MKDFKNTRYVEPVPIEVKIVHGGAFVAVMLALVVGACL